MTEDIASYTYILDLILYLTHLRIESPIFVALDNVIHGIYGCDVRRFGGNWV